jgi:hypothetical protein
MSMTSLSTAGMLAAFSDEITSRGGQVADKFHDGRRLFVRGVLALADDVRPGDRVQGGVALKATEGDVSVHPYVFRQVCHNGAIMAHSLGGERLEHVDWLGAETAEQRIRELIADCSREEVFAGAVEQFAAACSVGVDMALAMLAMFSDRSTHPAAAYLTQIMERFFRDEEPTGFGLVQAITATARDTRDAAVRWDLEELGGWLAAKLHRQPSHGPRQATRSLDEALVG